MKKVILIFLVLFLIIFGVKIVYDLANPEAVARFRDHQTSSQTFNLYFIALEDSGKRGPKIGCDDSVVAVKKSSSEETGPEQAVRELLQVRTEKYADTGLYNALYQSNLDVLSIEIKDGSASLYLKGNIRLGGTCDAPRFESQLTQTLKQFPQITSVSIFINSRPLSDYTSGR